jgi:hypothetical protein
VTSCSVRSLIQSLSCIGGFATSITYGIPIRRTHDPTVELTEKAFNALAEAATPGRFLVDVFPVLRHVPDWVPGSGFKKLAKGWRELLLRVRDEPFWETIGAMVSVFGAFSPTY